MRESIRRSLLNERVTDLPGWKAKKGYGGKAGYHDSDLVSVKLLQKNGVSWGRMRNGAKFLVSVNGAPFCIAYLCHSYPNEVGQNGYDENVYNEIVLALGDRLRKASDYMGGIRNRDRIGLGKISVNDFNFKNAEEAVRKIPNMEYLDVYPHAWNMDDHTRNTMSDIHIGFEGYRTFTIESAPYVIQTYVQALLVPENKPEKTYEIPDMDYEYGEYEDAPTGNAKEAWKKALSFYKEWGKELSLKHPKQYSDVESCLWDYYREYKRYRDEEAEMQAGDWEDGYQRWMYGDDEY